MTESDRHDANRFDSEDLRIHPDTLYSLVLHRQSQHLTVFTTMAMGKRSGLLALVVVAGLPLHTASIADGQTLRTCQSAGSIVAVEVQKAASTDRGVLASLIRLHFHHCFVNTFGAGTHTHLQL
ncbi:hypothetical protein HU200_018521 [Digitaria exilis]|uniref:Peroxidase n=1 Tax=Digitaria exilis TaxID=1010633 RepID=A0A835KIR9_9POAL|nr:hypothetical protein HU200_018521 [Digitaria exilis]